MKARAPRAYRMSARAEAAAQTHRAILEAAIRRFGAHPWEEVSLADVAREAGVTVQTVLRRFGSKEGLGEGALALGTAAVREERFSSPVGDLKAAVQGLMRHYETWGDRSLLFLSQENRVPAMRRLTDAGRSLHHEWVDHVFAPWLAKARGGARLRLRARLIATTDVYAWKILRRDLGFEPRAAEQTLREHLEAVLA